MEHHLPSCFVWFFGFYFLVLCKYIFTSDDACIGERERKKKPQCQHLNGCESNRIFIRFVMSYEKTNWWIGSHANGTRMGYVICESIFQSVRLFPAAINIFQNIGIIPSQFPHNSIFIFNSLTLLGRSFSTHTTDKSWWIEYDNNSNKQVEQKLCYDVTAVAFDAFELGKSGGLLYECR